MRLGQGFVELQRFDRGGRRLGHGFQRRHKAVKTQQIERVRQPGISQRIIGILQQRQLEIVAAFLQPGAALVPKKTAFEIKLIGFGIGGGLLDQGGVFAARQSNLQRLDNGA